MNQGKKNIFWCVRPKNYIKLSLKNDEKNIYERRRRIRGIITVQRQSILFYNWLEGIMKNILK